MTPLILGFSSLVVYAVGLIGFRMTRQPSGAATAVGIDGSQRQQQSVLTRFRRAFGQRVGPRVLAAMSDRHKARLEHWLDAAGRPDRLTLGEVAGIKAADTVIFTLIGAVLTWIFPIFLPFGILYGFFRQDLTLQSAAKKRQEQIERELPDYLDILGVTIQAGLKFRGALRRVGERFESPVADEFRIALQQMDVGASRRAAFEGIRERNDSPSLNRFVGALLQAEELGTPLTDSMIAISKDMRKLFGQNVRKRAAKAVPKVTLVATTVLMPGAALLLIGGLLIGGEINPGAALGGG